MFIHILNLTQQHLNVELEVNLPFGLMGLKFSLRCFVEQQPSYGNCGKIFELPALHWATHLAPVYKKCVKINGLSPVQVLFRVF